MNWITFELPAPLVVFSGIALASVLISLIPLSRFTGKPAPLQVVQDKMGLSKLNSGLFFLILLFWVVLLVGLFVGLLGLLHEIFTHDYPDAREAKAEWRFALTKIAAFTAVLGAVVALPFTLIRLSLSRQQVETALEALTNDKMNTAVDDLHAQRQVTKWKNKIASSGWEDDITRRNGAIDRLLGLVQENETLRPRVDRLLTVYLRELTREYPAKTPPEDATPEQFKEWASGLSRVRSDMENAVQVLSRLPRPEWYEGEKRLPDLQQISMQAFNLAGLSLQNADLSGAQLQGAHLSDAQLQEANLGMAQLQGADLSWAQLQGARLGRAQLQGANLSIAKLQGANLSGAQLQGAHLSGAKLQGANLNMAKLQGADLFRAESDSATDFSAATLRGAALKSVDFTTVPQIADHIDGLFGDDTVTFPEGVHVPERFKLKYDDYDAFITAWRAFQREIGQDPDNPE